MGLQNQRGGRGSELIFLLFGVQGLFCVIDSCLRRSDAGTVLLHAELGVADFDADLILDLLQTHLGLLEFQFRTNLQGLRGAITQRNIQL